MATTVHRTCTLCEATCGLTFQVDGDRILSVRPDPHDPISKGYVCPKGIAIAEVHDDPDRLRQPLRRTARGSFAPIAWKEALDEAADGLRRVRDRRDVRVSVAHDHRRHREQQRRIGAGADRDVLVGLARGLGAARIDHHHLAATLAQLAQSPAHVGRGHHAAVRHQRVRADAEEEVGAIDVGHRDRDG